MAQREDSEMVENVFVLRSREAKIVLSALQIVISERKWDLLVDEDWEDLCEMKNIEKMLREHIQS